MINSSLIVFFAFSVLLHFPSLTAWPQSWEPEKRLAENYDVRSMIVDPDQNIYLATTRGQLLKYDSQGDSIGYYSLPFGTAPDILAVQSNLRLFLFFEVAQQYLFLDRQLRTAHTYRLSGLGFEQVALVTPSTGDHLWVFDPIGNRVVKMDAESSVVQQEIDLGSLTEVGIAEVTHMVEQKHLLYLADPNLGVYVFDLVGKSSLVIKDTGIHYFEVVNDFLYYINSDKQLVLLSLSDQDLRTIDLPLAQVNKKSKRLTKCSITGSSIVLNQNGIVTMYKNLLNDY